MSVLISVLFIGLAVLFAIGSISHSVDKARGRSVCKFCGKRLKKVGAHYATVCAHCANKQPWAG
jgi:hypothetical protein